jgi:ADP-heptose:LPS heptosyltransferase
MLRRNVLIFHGGALGDFVLSWPLALALGRIYAQSRIIFVTHGQKGKLAERVLRLESSDVENGWQLLFSENAAPPSPIAGLLEGAHAIYTFSSPTENWNANVARLNPAAKVVMLAGAPPAEFAGHAADWLVEQLRKHPIERAATEQILRSIGDRGIGFKHSGGGDVVIHPGSGSPAKCWGVENFVRLAKRLREAGRKVRFVVGEVEMEKWPAQQIEGLAARRAGSYIELLDEISTAGVFVGNDSGPGHLAGIIGVPTVSIFMSTAAQRWKPIGPKVSVVEEDSVDAVFEAVSRSA